MRLFGDRTVVAILGGAFALFAGAGTVCGQGGSEVELTEYRNALQSALQKVRTLEKRVSLLESANVATGEGLAEANVEARQYREAYEKLRLQMEALGVEVILPGSAAIEQRLLKAVNDIRILEEEKVALAEQLMGLTEAAMSYMSTAPTTSEDDRLELEAQLRAAGEELGTTGATPPLRGAGSLGEARVINLKPEYGLIVLDAGDGAGVRVGTPLQVMREDRIIATALVVDVRGSFSGALVQPHGEEGQAVQVGDRVRVRMQQTL